MDSDKNILYLILIGIVAGLGRLLASDEKLTPRLVFGRAMASGILALAASSILVVMPDLSFQAQVGLSAAIASLGVSALERLFQNYINPRR